MTGNIVNIQYYSVHDGPGIRTLVFFKGCPLRCAWCCNPESQSRKPQLRFMTFLCKTCLECFAKCPCSGVELKNGKIGRNFELCDKCKEKYCIEVCNHEAVTLSGKEISSEELVGIIERDTDFYRNSGGGVTFSGGEPLMQPDFLLEVLQLCKSKGIHTAVETCGWAKEEEFSAILPYTDLFLFDLKIIDPQQHLIHTENTVEPILKNLSLLLSKGAGINIRFPLIPGITDTPENLKDVSELLKSHHLKTISIEPYHTLGREKYDEHGMPYSLDHLPLYKASQLEAIARFFVSEGLACVVV